MCVSRGEQCIHLLLFCAARQGGRDRWKAGATQINVRVHDLEWEIDKGSRKGGREVGREGGREGGRKGDREVGRKGGKGGREEGRKGGKGGREEGR